MSPADPLMSLRALPWFRLSSFVGCANKGVLLYLKECGCSCPWSSLWQTYTLSPRRATLSADPCGAPGHCPHQCTGISSWLVSSYVEMLLNHLSHPQIVRCHPSCDFLGPEQRLGVFSLGWKEGAGRGEGLHPFAHTASLAGSSGSHPP